MIIKRDNYCNKRNDYLFFTMYQNIYISMIKSIAIQHFFNHYSNIILTKYFNLYLLRLFPHIKNNCIIYMVLFILKSSTLYTIMTL